MTGVEILQYLESHSYEVHAQDCIAKVINRSYQIIDTIYDSKTDMLTIITPDNTFTFKWNITSFILH